LPTAGGSQYSATPTFQGLPQASAGHGTQHGQATSAAAVVASGYRSSASHHSAPGYSQTHHSYQHAGSSTAGQAYQPGSASQLTRQSYSSASSSYPSSPVSTVYQGYSGRSAGSDYASVVHPGSQRSYEQQYGAGNYQSSSTYQPPQSEYVSSQSAYHPGHYHGQPVTYQSSQYSQHQSTQSSGRSNSRGQNWQ